MQHAPDFFDWHSGFYEFTTPVPTLVETTRQVYTIGDPEQADLSVAQKRERYEQALQIAREIGHPDAEADTARVDEIRARL
jgi:hypothetical protein